MLQRSSSMVTRTTGGSTYALWVFKLFGHNDVRILNGGRAKWLAEGRPLTTEVPNYPPATYTALERDDATIRAFRDQVREHIKGPGTALVDVRSPQEYSGERRPMPEYPQEGTLRGGHILPLSVSHGHRPPTPTVPSRVWRISRHYMVVRVLPQTRM